ncbi:MAG: aldo/keto reductase [Bryobacteraceae bacterium]
MLYRRVPRNGDELSALGFGCMRLPQKDGAIDEPRAVRQIRHAIDRGVNYVDTAWNYHGGESERVLGRALAGGYREKVKLATKLPAWLVKSPEDMDRFLNTQLEKLVTNHIDYYMVHSLNGAGWQAMDHLGVTGFLDRALRDGRIVNAGFSFHGAPEEFKPIADAYPWTFCLMQYNYMDEQNQAGKAGLQYAASRGLAVMVMEPLLGGDLARPSPPPAVASIFSEARISRTPAAWALRWIWNHPEVTVVLSGMNEETHLEENLATASQAYPDSLTAGELDLIRRAAEKYREIRKVGCTSCGYCMPCPKGVEIAKCFEVYNNFHMFGQAPGMARFLYVLNAGGVFSGAPGYASQCEECKDCLEKCPQLLDIPSLLKQVAGELEAEDLSKTEAMVRQMLMLG